GGDGPRAAAVAGMEYAARAKAACCKPRFALRAHRQAASARREGALIRHRGGSCLLLPMLAAIRGCEHSRVTVYRIADEDAAARIPKSQRIEKALRVRIREQQLPIHAAIHRLVNARLFPGADTHQVD